MSTLHHRHAAEQSRRQILQEIRTNAAEVRDVIHDNEAGAKLLDEAIRSLFKDVRGGVPALTINKTFMARYHGMPIGLRLPTFHHEAWDVAVANQAATYLDEIALRRYSAAYASQREFRTSFGSAIEVLNIPGLTRGITDLDLCRADPVEILRTLQRAEGTCRLVDENLAGLRDDLEAASRE